MRLVLLTLLLLTPPAAHAAEVLVAVGMQFLPFWAQVAITVAMSVYGAQQARRADAARREAQRAAYNAGLKDRLVTRVAADAPHRYVYGRVKVGADVVAILTSGDKDQYKHLVCVHAAHECDGFEEIYIAGKALGALDADGNVTSGDYTVTNTLSETEYKTGASFTLAHVPTNLTITRIYRESELDVPYTLVGSTVTLAKNYGQVTCVYQYTTITPRVRVKKHLGTPTDPADDSLLAECPSLWNSAAVLRGFCYTVVRLDLGQPEFQGGIPDIQVLLRGKKLYDPRSGLTVWSENNTLVTMDYLTSEICGVPSTDLPEADYIAAANVCDENIGGNMKRYTFSGDVTADQDQQKVLETMAQSMAGNIVSTTWGIAAGKYTAPVMALNFDDGSTLVGALAVSPGVSDADLYNGVRGQYASAENGYISTDFKPFQNAVYVAADGRELWQNIDFPYTGSVQRVHNLCRIFAEDQRNGYTIKASLSLKCWKLKVGQRVTVTSAFLGMSAKVFRVIDRKYAPDTAVELTLKEDTATIWDIADAVTADSTPNTNLPNPFTIAPLATLTCSSGDAAMLLQEDGTVVTRILAEWPQATTQAVVTNGMIEVEWQKFGVATRQKTQVSGSDTNAYLTPVNDGAYYSVRARTVNPYLNVKSDWVYATHQVIGKTALPAGVRGFTASQNGDVVVYQWDEPTDKDMRKGDHDIRYVARGGVWESGTPVVKKLRGNQITTAAVPPGNWTMMIMAVDSSKNASLNEARFELDVVNTFNLVYQENEAPAWHGTLTGLVRHWTGVLVPQSQNLASADDWETFDQLVPNPVVACEYEHSEIDFGFDAELRAWNNVDARVPPSGSGTAEVMAKIDYRIAVGAYDGYEPWTVGNIAARYARIKLIVDTSLGTPVLHGFTPTLDVKETRQTFTAAIAAGGSVITWPTRYHNPPSVGATVQGTTGLIAVIDPATITATGATAHVFNTSNADVGGTITVDVTGA